MGPAIVRLEDLFLAQAWERPVLFFSVLLTVVLSVVLHELGHGYAALAQGDDTPRAMGHLTLDPLVHMGPFSLLVLCLVGIAWGQTPVNPARFRHRYGAALVSAAGPAVNLVLALLGLTAWALWTGRAPAPEGHVAQNFQEFLWVFGVTNVVLLLFNLIPVPPLDGSAVLATFVRPYGRLVRDPQNRGMWLALFVVVFVFAGRLFEAAYDVAALWRDLLAG